MHTRGIVSSQSWQSTERELCVVNRLSARCVKIKPSQASHFNGGTVRGGDWAHHSERAPNGLVGALLSDFTYIELHRSAMEQQYMCVKPFMRNMQVWVCMYPKLHELPMDFLDALHPRSHIFGVSMA